ncbi:MAG: hypothetical protein ACRCU2_10500 [Planktothrix sp.]
MKDNIKIGVISRPSNGSSKITIKPKMTIKVNTAINTYSNSTIPVKHFKHLDVLDNHNKHLISSVATVKSIPKIIPTIAILLSRFIAILKIDDIKD